MRDRLEPGGELVDRVERPGQQREGRDDEVGDRGGMIEFFGPHRGQQPEEAQHHRPEDAEQRDRPWMLRCDVDAGPEQHGGPERDTDEDRARHRGADKRDNQLAHGERRHQIIDDGALYLADEEREARIGEAVLQHRHHDQAGGNEIGEGNAYNAAPRTAQRDGENHEEKKRRDRRSPDSLELDLEKAPHLLDI